MPHISEVSVVIPCYNAWKTLGRALRSVANQTVKASKVIIIDDGSDNPTSITDIIAQYSAELNIRLHRLDVNCGAPAARNLGIKMSTTEMVALLDADDFWAKNKLEIQLRVMAEAGASISCHLYLANSSQEALLVDGGENTYGTLSLTDFILHNPVVTPTVLFRKDTAPEFDIKMRRCDDYKAWIETITKGTRFILIRTKLAGGGKPALGHSGLTGSVDKMHKATLECLQALKANHNVPRSFIMAAAIVERIKYPIRWMRTNIHKFIKKQQCFISR